MIRINRRLIFPQAVLCLILALTFTGCGVKQAQGTNAKKKILTSELNNSSNDVKNGDTLDDYQKMMDKILDSGTSVFFGCHPIDENFLSFIASWYGINVLRDIVSNNNYSDPEIWFTRTGKSIHVLWDEYTGSSNLYKVDTNRTKEIQPASTDETVLDFTGDFGMAEGMATTVYLDQIGDDLRGCFSKELLKETEGADLFEINNEFCYSNGGSPLQGKDYTFRANPDKAKLLSEIGVDFVNLANNHVYDYGPQALLDTLDTLDADKISYLGAGRNLDEASKPLYYIANGRKIAIVSATQIERSLDYTKEATDDSPGVLKTLDPEKYIKVIKEASKKADVVIAIVHWGTEQSSTYGNDQVKLAEAFSEAGADAIIGCHSHCLQGIENMNGTPVFFSLGNYWFATSGSMPSDYASGIAQIRIQKDGKVKARFLPCVFKNGITSLITDAGEKSDKISYVQGLSKSVNISEDGEISPK